MDLNQEIRKTLIPSRKTVGPIIEVTFVEKLRRFWRLFRNKRNAVSAVRGFWKIAYYLLSHPSKGPQSGCHRNYVRRPILTGWKNFMRNTDNIQRLLGRFSCKFCCITGIFLLFFQDTRRLVQRRSSQEGSIQGTDCVSLNVFIWNRFTCLIGI